MHVVAAGIFAVVGWIAFFIYVVINDGSALVSVLVSPLIISGLIVLILAGHTLYASYQAGAKQRGVGRRTYPH